MKGILRIALGACIGVLAAFYLVQAHLAYETRKTLEAKAEADKQAFYEAGRQACIRDRSRTDKSKFSKEQHIQDYIDCMKYERARGW